MRSKTNIGFSSQAAVWFQFWFWIQFSVHFCFCQDFGFGYWHFSADSSSYLFWFSFSIYLIEIFLNDNFIPFTWQIVSSKEAKSQKLIHFQLKKQKLKMRSEKPNVEYKSCILKVRSYIIRLSNSAPTTVCNVSGFGLPTSQFYNANIF